MSQVIAALKDAAGPGALIADPDALPPFVEEERGLYQSRPVAVVAPDTVADLQKVVKACARLCVPIVPQGGNTGLCGGAVAAGDGDQVIVSTRRLRRLRAIDPDDETGVFEAGMTVLDAKEAARQHGLDLPISYGSEGTATVGGAVATNAGGMDAVRHGCTRDLVRGLEVVLADGARLDLLRGLKKDNTGYDLRSLFIGSEGTLGIVTAAKLQLVPAVPVRATAAVAVQNVRAGLDLLRHARRMLGPALLRIEILSRAAVDLTQAQFPELRPIFDSTPPWLVIVEAGRPGDRTPDTMLESMLAAAFEQGQLEDAAIAQTEAQARQFWWLREAVIDAQKRDGAGIKHDVSVPLGALPDFLDRAATTVDALVPGARPVPFGHLGDGNIHYNVQQPPGPFDRGFLATWDRVAEAIHDLAVALGGSFSAEHGIGLLKTGDMARHKSPEELTVMARVKRVLDPTGLLNPGKVLPGDPDRP